MQRINPQCGDGPGNFWLANILLRQDRPFVARLTLAFDRLRRLSRRRRNLLKHRLGLTLGGVALLLALSAAPVRAETIVVHDGEVEIASNHRCSLIEAIANANDLATGQPHADCTPGDPAGLDTIFLPGNGHFILTRPIPYYSYYSGQTGLPLIRGQVTIEGHGSTIESIPEQHHDFRLLVVGKAGDLTLKEVTITGFIASGASQGGAIFNAGTLTINDSALNDNFAYVGGAIYSYGGDSVLTIRRTTLSGNWAEQAGAIGASSGYDGRLGGIGIYDSTLSGNATYGPRSSGGALVVFKMDTTIDNTTISDNTVGPLGVGGGIHNLGGVMTVTNSTVSHNSARRGAGIANAGLLQLTNSTLSGNTAEEDGGAMINFDSATLTGVTLTGNNALRGGGIFNSASLACDKVCVPRPYGAVTLAHSLLSGNKASAGRELYNETASYYGVSATGIVAANDYNLLGYNGDPGLVNVTLQPLDFVPHATLAQILDSVLADRGGPTRTHRLVDGSPALDMVPNEACNATPVNGTDQRGALRNVNRAGAISDHDCDIGAFELQIEFPIFAPVVAR